MKQMIRFTPISLIFFYLVSSLLGFTLLFILPHTTLAHGFDREFYADLNTLVVRVDVRNHARSALKKTLNTYFGAAIPVSKFQLEEWIIENFKRGISSSKPIRVIGFEEFSKKIKLDPVSGGNMLVQFDLVLWASGDISPLLNQDVFLLTGKYQRKVFHSLGVNGVQEEFQERDAEPILIGDSSKSEDFQNSIKAALEKVTARSIPYINCANFGPCK